MSSRSAEQTQLWDLTVFEMKLKMKTPSQFAINVTWYIENRKTNWKQKRRKYCIFLLRNQLTWGKHINHELSTVVVMETCPVWFTTFDAGAGTPIAAYDHRTYLLVQHQNEAAPTKRHQINWQFHLIRIRTYEFMVRYGVTWNPPFSTLARTTSAKRSKRVKMSTLNCTGDRHLILGLRYYDFNSWLGHLERGAMMDSVYVA